MYILHFLTLNFETATFLCVFVLNQNHFKAFSIYKNMRKHKFLLGLSVKLRLAVTINVSIFPCPLFITLYHSGFKSV